MSTVINVIIALLVFGAIIFFHELGHFLLAKKNGIYVNEFAVGMGPTLFSFTKKETKYSLKLIPMGGYCMMLGEDEDVQDEHSFSTKPVWARISVVVAGPLFNFILAFLLSIVLIAVCGYDSPRISDFSEESPAKEAGVQTGDIIPVITVIKYIISVRFWFIPSLTRQERILHLPWTGTGKSCNTSSVLWRRKAVI